MDWTTIALAVTTCVLLLYRILFKGFYQHNYPPGPKSIPFVGNGPLLKKMTEKLGGMHLALMELAKQYNTKVLGLTLGADYYVVVFTEEYVKEILLREEFQARPENFFIRLRTMGTKKGITMTDGRHWEEQRPFLVRHLRNLGFGRTVMESLIHDELKNLFSSLGDKNDCVQLSEHLPKSVLNVLWVIATGKMFTKGDSRLEQLLYFMNCRSKAFDMAGGLLSQMPWLRYIAPEKSGYNLIVRLNQQLSQIIKNSIIEHKKTYNLTETRDFIDAFLHQMNLEDSETTSFTEDQLIMVCLDLFIAGSQTTSNTLDFALMRMVLHPDAQEKVQKEIDSILKPGEFPKMTDRKRMPYTEAVLSESQRICHVTPMIGPRRVLANTTINGYYVPKGATVLMNMHSIRKNPVEWEDPEEFKPERFLSEEGEYIEKKQFYPFGLGKRRCPGEALAKNFLFIFFVGLLQKYKMDIIEDKKPSTIPIPGISLSPCPYSVKLRSRQ